MRSKWHDPCKGFTSYQALGKNVTYKYLLLCVLKGFHLFENKQIHSEWNGINPWVHTIFIPKHESIPVKKDQIEFHLLITQIWCDSSTEKEWKVSSKEKEAVASSYTLPPSSNSAVCEVCHLAGYPTSLK